MSFSFAGNKFSLRNNSDDYSSVDNSRKISNISNVSVNLNSNDTYHIGMESSYTKKEITQDELKNIDPDAVKYFDDQEKNVRDEERDWLDYCRRVLYHVKETIIAHEDMGHKLENIAYIDPDCEVLSITFVTEDGQLDKVIMTEDDIYGRK